MKWHGIVWGFIALLFAWQTSLRADEDSNGDRTDYQRQSRNSRDQDNGVRAHYDDDTDRLSIDANEDVQFRDDNSKRDWVKGGEFDLRYDTDRNDLRASGEGTIDVDRAAGQIARWRQRNPNPKRAGKRSARSKMCSTPDGVNEIRTTNAAWRTRGLCVLNA